MAFPTVVGRHAAGSSGSNSTIFDPSLTGRTFSVPAGSLWVLIISVDGSPTVTMSGGDTPGWSKLGQGSNSTVVTGAVFYGTFPDSYETNISPGGTVNFTASEQASAMLLVFSGSNLTIDGVSANGSSTNSNPPNLSSATDLLGNIDGTSKDYLWIATRSGDGTTQATAAPTNYSSLTTQAASGTNGAATATADRTLNAASEDPGTFTSATEQWVSFTVAVWEGTVVPKSYPAVFPGAQYQPFLAR